MGAVNRRGTSLTTAAGRVDAVPRRRKRMEWEIKRARGGGREKQGPEALLYC